MNGTQTSAINLLALLSLSFHRRRCRRLFNQTVREQTTAQFYPHIERATSGLLINLLRHPEAFQEHALTYVHCCLGTVDLTLSRFGARTLFSTAYGSDLSTEAGFSLAAWERFPEMMETGTPGAYLVVNNTFPDI
jgi:hypothetical protein